MSDERFDMRPVDSSHIEVVGWRETEITDVGILRVEFSNGALYDYFDVPRGVFMGILEAPSAGRYLNDWVKPMYQALKVEGGL